MTDRQTEDYTQANMASRRRYFDSSERGQGKEGPNEVQFMAEAFVE